MMGDEGLKLATQIAILNANYLKKYYLNIIQFYIQVKTTW